MKEVLYKYLKLVNYHCIHLDHNGHEPKRPARTMMSGLGRASVWYHVRMIISITNYYQSTCYLHWPWLKQRPPASQSSVSNHDVITPTTVQGPATENFDRT